jgi:hypothetical protein
MSLSFQGKTRKEKQGSGKKEKREQMFMLSNYVTLLLMILRIKVSLRVKRGILTPVSLRAQRGNLIRK